MGEDQAPVIDADSEEAVNSAAIDAEIAEGLAGEKGAFGLLNNFETKLPGGFFETRYDPNDLFSQDDEAESPRRITNGVFLADRDKAISDSGIDPHELERLRTAYKSTSGVARSKNQQAYLGYAVPVYRQLRLMGYSANDLAA